MAVPGREFAPKDGSIRELPKLEEQALEEAVEAEEHPTEVQQDHEWMQVGRPVGEHPEELEHWLDSVHHLRFDHSVGAAGGP